MQKGTAHVSCSYTLNSSMKTDAVWHSVYFCQEARGNA